jgi:hypothetical protein
VGGERKSDATARRNAARNKKDAEVLAARDAKVVSVNPFFLEKELLPKQTWPAGAPEVRAGKAAGSSMLRMRPARELLQVLRRGHGGRDRARDSPSHGRKDAR